MTNHKRATAQAKTAAEVTDLRAHVITTAQALVKISEQLDDLADTYQSIGPGMVTEESLAARDRQVAADRAAARGLDRPTRAVGLAFLNSASILGNGHVVAPVSIAATSASADVRFVLLRHLRRLSRTAGLVALEAEQTAAEDQGVCWLPRHPILTLGAPTDTEPVDKLVTRLILAIASYTNRDGLREILRELERAEANGRDVIDGPARANHPDPCPWCGRHSLVVHHRSPGRDVQTIRCEGPHPCVCDWEHCACHTNPHRWRHAWENSGHATHTWTQLRNLQNARKEAMAYETRAADAVARALELHSEIPVYPWVEDCTDTDHDASDTLPTDTHRSICTACEPVNTACEHCRDDAGQHVPWPCLTATTLNPDLESAHDHTTD